ncbi:MAG TPA: TldD/PmbA family protein [Candidatus Limnocylindrales bacterium]|nr:TldD/PmbA family protein [Candidatus Limnocylindrales bacterium]
MSPKTKKSKAPRAPAGKRFTQAELQAIAERIFKLSEADETEVEIDVTSDALTRFANNVIHQNVAEEVLHVSVRAVVDGRTARAATNKVDEDSLRRVTASALSLAANQPENPDLLPMLGRQKYQKVARFFPATAAASPQDRARAVTRVCRMAGKNKQTAAGIFSSGHMQTILSNSKGLFAHHEQTRSEFSITILEPNSSGWAKANSPDIRQLDPDALAASASRKASDSRAPQELPPGHYTVILSPSAVLDLVGFLFYDFAGTAVLDKRSCFNDRMGKKIFGENITLCDDVYHPLQLGAPYDGEGVPRQKVVLVDRGVPKNLVYARSTAKKMKTRPTGHGFGLPNEYGEAPMNLVFAGGDKSIDEMIRSTERGIFVTRLWYIREVDPYEKILTGMTRDGTFLVENGLVSAGIRNFRFNQSILEMLAKVEMLGPAVRAAGEESFEMVVPAMKVRDFHFTEVTKF